MQSETIDQSAEGEENVFNPARELEMLFEPVEPHTFAREYWGRKALHVAGSPGKLAGLLGRSWDRAAFLQAIEEGFRNEPHVRSSNRSKLYDVDVVRAEFDHSRYLEAGDGVRPFMALRQHQIAPSLAAGATIRLYGLMEVDAGVRRFAERLKSQLHYPGDVVVNGVLSPRSRGVNLHFDPEDILIFQTAGRKRYLFSPEPVVSHPRGKGFVFADGTVQYTDTEKVIREVGYEPWEQAARVRESDLIEVTLEPGDVLYWPAGTVHKTIAEETGESVGLLLVFLPFNFRRLLDYTLERMLLGRPEWRHMPVWAGDDHGGIPDPIREFFEARWSELQGLLERMSPTGLELNRMWHECIQPLTPVDREGTEATAIVSAEDRLRVRREAGIACAQGEDREGRLALHIYCGAKEIEIEEAWVPFFETLLETGSFIAGESCRWRAGETPYPWEQVQEYLSALCTEGLLERAQIPQLHETKGDSR